MLTRPVDVTQPSPRVSDGGLPLGAGRAAILKGREAGHQLWRQKNGEQHLNTIFSKRNPGFFRATM